MVHGLQNINFQKENTSKIEPILGYYFMFVYSNKTFIGSSTIEQLLQLEKKAILPPQETFSAGKTRRTRKKGHQFEFFSNSQFSVSTGSMPSVKNSHWTLIVLKQDSTETSSVFITATRSWFSEISMKRWIKWFDLIFEVIQYPYFRLLILQQGVPWTLILL